MAPQLSSQGIKVNCLPCFLKGGLYETSSHLIILVLFSFVVGLHIFALWFLSFFLVKWVQMKRSVDNAQKQKSDIQ
jgi:uncharacterized membrane protein YciS (DUF1049 family)